MDNQSQKQPQSPEASDDQKITKQDEPKDDKTSKSDSTEANNESTDKSPEPSAPSESSSPSISSQPSEPKPQWYVVHTYSGHEAKVATTLKQRIDSQKLADKVLDIIVPTQEKIEIKEGKKTQVKEKIFPGYLLVRMIMDDSTWLAVRTTPGITSFVGNANRPTPLPDEEVETIKKFMAMEAPKFKASFSVSEAVKITDGPFTDFLGSISEIDDTKGKLKVMVSIFGRETPVELDFLQVAKL